MTEEERRAVARETIWDLFQQAKYDMSSYESMGRIIEAENTLEVVRWLYTKVDWPPDPDKQL
jgi:hypothetical protein